ncbi:unnamed protein product [Spirodela intermedia]|uniref:Uncharacterized protein n=1 Tax=Spirodela intermedia TaxID=51605 RepID=A0A7I8IC04_SPIIN|nr:unnamed protein product [Spirodela intermedia]CAA6654873.1 unnamed protein product [Spirodela intermedia]
MQYRDRFRNGGDGGGGTSASWRKERSPRRAAGERKEVAPGVRSRGGVVGNLLLPPDRVIGEGFVHHMKQNTGSKVESDGRIGILHQQRVSAFDNRKSLLKRPNGTRVKSLMDEEIPNQVASRRHSPSVIAKLMGLDSLPAPHSSNLHSRESTASFHKASSRGSHGEKSREFKDVFEVMETEKVEKRSWSAHKGSLKSRQRDTDMAVIRQTFMDAKRLSMNEELQHSQELSDALEVLDSSKELFLKFLEEPDSLFMRQLQDLHPLPAAPEARITILKSSNMAKYESSEVCRKSETMADRSAPGQKHVAHKSETDSFVHRLREHPVSHSRQPSKSKLDQNEEPGFLPTRIVVLKPSLQKVNHGTAEAPGTAEDLQFGDRRSRESKRYGRRETFPELRERHTLSGDSEVTHRTRRSREIAKEVTWHMRHTVTGEHGRPYDSRHSTLSSHGYPQRSPATSSLSGHTDSQSDAWGKSYSAPYLTETHATRDARRHLSERWMMAHKQRDTLSERGCSTLGEMLALSDGEMLEAPSSSLPCRGSLQERISGKKVLERWSSPRGISSKDGWKDGQSGGLRRSKSVPASSAINGSLNSFIKQRADRVDNPFVLKDLLNLGSRRSSEPRSSNQRSKASPDTSQASNTDEEENKRPVREIHVDHDELLDRSPEKALPMDKSCSSGSCSPVEVQQPSQSLCSTSSAVDNYYTVDPERETGLKETSPDHPQAEFPPGQTPSVIPKEGDQPSPISVLEQPIENGSPPESFERLSADLRELRLKLQLLKLESADAYADGLVGSDEVDSSGEILGSPTFVEEEDRDFAYLLQILSEAGFHRAEWDELFCGIREARADVQQRGFWPKADRKLLFDIVNLVLADLLALNMELRPWVKKNGGRDCRRTLTEEVWEFLGRQRAEVLSANSGKFLDDARGRIWRMMLIRSAGRWSGC